jgi:hypothetical protein
MKYFIITYFFIFLTTSLPSQRIVGKVININGAPISFANVIIHQLPDSSFYAGTVSDDQGLFGMGVEKGDYYVAVKALGYQSQITNDFRIERDDHDLGVLSIETESTVLEEIMVTAEKPIYEQKIDRLVVNVANSIAAAGGTALEVLERSPGVVVNRQWNSIGLNGKQGVLIMINNKISRVPADAVVQMLNGMSAENIEKIELIHTPPANFEAEGNAGIIHIVLKKSADRGLNGSVSTFAGYGRGEKWGASANFNYRKKRINVYGDMAYTFDRMQQLFDLERSFTLDGKTFTTTTFSERNTYNASPQIRLGLDYQWMDKTTIGLLAAYSENKFEMDAVTTARKLQDKQIIDSLHMPSDEVNRRWNLLYNFNVEHRFSETNIINFDVDYVDYTFSNPSNYFGHFYDSTGFVQLREQRVRSNTPMDIWSANLGYRFQPTESLSVETGAKARTARFNNDVSLANKINDTWEFDPAFTSKVDMVEDVLAAYVSFSYRLHENTNIKAGLRYEYTMANLGSEEQPDLVDRTYGNFFPSVYLSQKIDAQNQLQLSYSRRINRPDFTMLAPYYYFFDPTTLLTGDPSLQPSLTDKVNLSYQWKTVQLQLNYSYESGAMVNFQVNNDPTQDIAVIIPENFDFSRVFNATLSVPFKPASWIEIRNNISAVRQRFVDTREDGKFQIDNNGWNYNGSINLNLPQQYALEFSGFYRSKSLMGALIFDPMWQFNVGAQKELANGWGTLKFSVSDLFLGSNWTLRQTSPQNDFRYEGFFRMSQRLFRLTYSMNFGNRKLKNARSRTTSSAEERSRVN